LLSADQRRRPARCMGWPGSRSRSQSEWDAGVVARQMPGWLEDSDLHGGARNELSRQSACNGAPWARGILLARLRHSCGVVKDNRSVRRADDNLDVGTYFIGQEMRCGK
jgi:hypothetical protein